jgi:hypothetical protein
MTSILKQNTVCFALPLYPCYRRSPPSRHKRKPGGDANCQNHHAQARDNLTIGADLPPIQIAIQRSGRLGGPAGSTPPSAKSLGT